MADQGERRGSAFARQDSCTSLNDQNQVFIEQLLRGDFGLCNEILQRISIERQDEFSEILFEFSQKHNIVFQLMKWAVDTTVEANKRTETIFREDSFQGIIVSRLLFNSAEGVQFLQPLLIRTISFVASLDYSLQVGLDKVQALESLKNTTTLLEIAQKFFDHFQQMVTKCPRPLCELARILESSVYRKFNDKSQALSFTLSFFFFKYVCVALYNPAKYQLGGPEVLMKPHVQSNLVLISKLFNDFALNNSSSPRFNDLINKYIAEKHPFLLQQMQVILAKKDKDDDHESVTSSGVSESSSQHDEETNSISNDGDSTDTEFDSSLTHLRSFLHSINFDESQVEKKSEAEDKSMTTFEQNRLQFYDSYHNDKWKKAKETKDFVMWTVKDRDSQVGKVKAELAIDVPVMEVFKLIHDRYTELDPFCVKYNVLREEQVSPNMTFGIYYMMHDLPLLLSARESVTCHWIHKISDNHIIWTIKSGHEELVPRIKNCVRATIFASGYEIKAEEGNPKRCKLGFIFNGNAGGMVPGFMLNHAAMGQAMKLVTAKTILEKNSDLFNALMADMAAAQAKGSPSSPARKGSSRSKSDKKSKKEKKDKKTKKDAKDSGDIMLPHT